MVQCCQQHPPTLREKVLEELLLLLRPENVESDEN